jgi:hypothetical protein
MLGELLCKPLNNSVEMPGETKEKPIILVGVMITFKTLLKVGIGINHKMKEEEEVVEGVAERQTEVDLKILEE